MTILLFDDLLFEDLRTYGLANLAEVVYQRLILDVAHATDKDIIDTLVVVYNSWITRKIDNYNSSMYYESPSYLFESYKAGAVLV